MAVVVFSNLLASASTGTPVMTTFTDAFSGTSGGMGSNWVQGCMNSVPSTDPFNVSFTQMSIGPVTGGGQGLSLTNVREAGGTSTDPFPEFAIPLPLASVGAQNPMTGIGLQQFAQMRVVHLDRSGNPPAIENIFAGPMVLFNSGGSLRYQCYFFAAFSGIGSAFLFEFRAPLTFTNLGVNGVVADGDVIKITAVPTATENTIECFVNGVSVGSIVDNSVTRSTYGLPAIFSSSAGFNVPPPSPAAEFSDFSGGQF